MTVGLVPDMVQSKECHYKKAYIRTVLRMKEFIKIVDGQRNYIARLENELNNIKNNNQCNCQRPQQVPAAVESGGGRPFKYK